MVLNSAKLKVKFGWLPRTHVYIYSQSILYKISCYFKYILWGKNLNSILVDEKNEKFNESLEIS